MRAGEPNTLDSGAMRETRLEQLRKRAGGRLMQGFFSGAAQLGRLHPLASPERHGVEVIRDVPYLPGSDRPEHRLDVYRPRERHGPTPTVLYIHGGAFRILSKDTHWVMGLAFASRGYTVFNLSYRLAPRHPFPAPVEDVAAAYRWVVDHAARYGADVERMVVAGESAGANLATAVTLASVYDRDEPFARQVHATGIVPRATAPACGVFQVTDQARFARRKRNLPRFVHERLEEMERGYVGQDPSAHGATIDFADPLLWLERGERPDRPLPPFFIPVGTRDPLLDDTRRLASAIEALGGTAEPRYYEGGVHAFHAFVFLEQAREVWRDKFAFLAKHVPRDPGG